MFIWNISFGGAKSLTEELPRPNLRLDPRPILDGGYDESEMTFDVTYHDDGITITIAKTGRKHAFEQYEFRVYDPAEEKVPNFKSSSRTYNYQGIEGDRAPGNTFVGYVDSSVTVIRESAFSHCTDMKFCFMHDDVKVIDRLGFAGCTALKIIKLPRNLKRIGPDAFRDCEALDAIFIPDSVEEIDDHAFDGCKNIRILSLYPDVIDFSVSSSITLRDNVVKGCDTFFRITKLLGYEYQDFNIHWNGNQAEMKFLDEEEREGRESCSNDAMNRGVMEAVNQLLGLVNQTTGFLQQIEENEEEIEERNRVVEQGVRRAADRAASSVVYKSILDFYIDLPPLHKACLCTHVSPRTIRGCIEMDGPENIFVIDHDGMTPLHILTMNPHATPATILKCLNLNMNAALLKDNSNMMPMDYLWKYERIQSLISVIQALCLHREAHQKNMLNVSHN